LFVYGFEDGVDLRIAGHVARQQNGAAHLCRELFDALFQALALIGERETHSLCGQSLSDGPGDGTLVRHAEDDSRLPFKQRHDLLLAQDAPTARAATARGSPPRCMSTPENP